jgi:hypothetical protein
VFTTRRFERSRCSDLAVHDRAISAPAAIPVRTTSNPVTMVSRMGIALEVVHFLGAPVWILPVDGGGFTKSSEQPVQATIDIAVRILPNIRIPRFFMCFPEPR